MLSLSEKSVLSFSRRAASIGSRLEPIHIPIEPILVELAEMLLQNVF
jgi:hypothetical protein